MKKTAVLSMLTVLLILSSCTKKIEPVRSQRLLLGTAATISIFDRGVLTDVPAEIESVFDYLSTFEELWAYDSENSDLTSLRENAGNVSRNIDPNTYRLLAQGVKLETDTDGYFNIRLGPVTDLWGFHSDKRYVPSAEEISRLLPLTEGGMFFAGSGCLLGVEGMGIDVGGIGKGFAVDLAVERLLDAGAGSGIVEAGGDLRVFGLPGENQPWKIGIRHPRNLEAFFAVLDLKDGAVATSGDYQQYFIAEGIRFHHILDPETGFPADKCVSATVTAKTCIEADAAATAVFVMGPELGMAWLSSHDDYSGVIIYYDESDSLSYLHTPDLQISFNP